MKRGQNNGNARRENAALLSRKCHKSTREGGTAGRCRGGPGVAGTGGERRTRGCNVLMLAAPWWAGGRGRQVFFLSFFFFLLQLFLVCVKVTEEGRHFNAILVCVELVAWAVQ